MTSDRSTYIASPLPIEGELQELFGPGTGVTIFDIGACEGEDTVRYARLFPGGNVFAVEPIPANVERLHATLRRYGIENVHVLPYALSNTEGMATIHVSSGEPPGRESSEDWDYGNKSSSLLIPEGHLEVHPWVRFDSTMPVLVRRLDEVCAARGITQPDFLHIDVQGAELRVLEGAGRFLNDVTGIWLEVEALSLYRGQPLREEVEAFLQAHGFRKTKDTVGSISGDQLWINGRSGRRVQAARARADTSADPRATPALSDLTFATDGSEDTPEGSTQPNPGEVVGTLNAKTRERWVQDALHRVPAGWRLLDVGAGEQPYRRFCDHLEYVSQDLAEYDGTGDGAGLQQGAWTVSPDIVSDLTRIPVPDRAFDVVLCTEVLEHVPDPALAIKEFARVIRPGGQLITTAPFASLTHQAPFHFSSGLSRYWYEHHLAAAGFKIDELTPNGNFFDFVAQELRRVPFVADRYRAGGPTRLERMATNVLLRTLARMSAGETGSSELLTFGWHVRATRVGDADEATV